MIPLPAQNGAGSQITMQTRSSMITSCLRSGRDMGSREERLENWRLMASCHLPSYQRWKFLVSAFLSLWEPSLGMTDKGRVRANPDIIRADENTHHFLCNFAHTGFVIDRNDTSCG